MSGDTGGLQKQVALGLSPGSAPAASRLTSPICKIKLTRPPQQREGHGSRCTRSSGRALETQWEPAVGGNGEAHTGPRCWPQALCSLSVAQRPREAGQFRHQRLPGLGGPRTIPLSTQAISSKRQHQPPAKSKTALDLACLFNGLLGGPDPDLAHQAPAPTEVLPGAAAHPPPTNACGKPRPDKLSHSETLFSRDRGESRTASAGDRVLATFPVTTGCPESTAWGLVYPQVAKVQGGL